MRKSLVLGVAAAALCGAPAFGQPLPPPIFNWTGFYWGVNLGVGAGHSSATFSPNDAQTTNLLLFASNSAGSPNPVGILVGGQVGVNWLVGPNWLFGLEADFAGTGISDKKATQGLWAGAVPLTIATEVSYDWLATARGRVGFLAGNGVLIFVTGGLAVAQIEGSGSYAFPPGTGVTTGPVFITCTSACYAGSETKVKTGWTGGGGFEFVLSNTATLKVEYLYVDLGNHSVQLPAVLVNAGNPAPMTATFHNILHVARLGLNIKM